MLKLLKHWTECVKLVVHYATFLASFVKLSKLNNQPKLTTRLIFLGGKVKICFGGKWGKSCMKPSNKFHFFPFGETWKQNFVGGVYVDHSVLKVSRNLQEKLHSGLLALQIHRFHFFRCIQNFKCWCILF